MKKKIYFYLLCMFGVTSISACSEDDSLHKDEIENPGETTDNENTSDEQDDGGNSSTETSRTLVVYFSATGNTHQVAEYIADITRADIYRIEPSVPYPENPYDVSEAIRDEAYNNLRPEIANLPNKEYIAAHDTIFIGSPIWWHQPAMVVCTFLDTYNFDGKIIVPFFTYGATTYLNESMQKIYRETPSSIHIPESLPEDLEPDNIQSPQSDDAGIIMPGQSDVSVRAWLKNLGIL